MQYWVWGFTSSADAHTWRWESIILALEEALLWTSFAAIFAAEAWKWDFFENGKKRFEGFELWGTTESGSNGFSLTAIGDGNSFVINQGLLNKFVNKKLYLPLKKKIPCFLNTFLCMVYNFEPWKVLEEKRKK